MNAMGNVRSVRVEIAGRALQSVFEECDRYDSDETGGRLVGHFALERNTLVVRARGVIEPGPNAKRTRSSFFQDGEYQTKIFRRIEAKYPTIEHLGNWHTHHVNGFPNLSGGDIATYRRIVNHELHNLDFFYALLVTARREGRSGLGRYAVRHYVLFRGDNEVYEVDPRDVRITDEAAIWPKDAAGAEDEPETGDKRTERAVAVRAHDQQVLEVMYPSLRPRLSARSETFYWKGPLPLVDGTEAELRVLEVEDDEGLAYYPRVNPASAEAGKVCETSFPSASEAVRALEQRLNQAIYLSAARSEG
ncbi:MAG: hypothetical protein OXP09_18960 [Gammaproteobacteria bacterium]|nr:hypothetical protein [Gammaproteobacteria bacterium]MDE0367645.1 hypothetical protein [Gammaproteobacteria bacterium]